MTLEISATRDERRGLAGWRLVTLSCGWVILAVLCFLSLWIGARAVSAPDIINAILFYDPQSTDQIAIHDYRLPRTLLGLICGAAFGVAGALMQVTTRNPIADPGLLGVNAGAAFFVSIAAILGVHSIAAQVWLALVGAIVTTVLVYIIGASGRQGPTPIRLLLAGVAIAAVLNGTGSALTLLNPVAFDAMRVWMLGSLGGRSLEIAWAVVPFISLGLAIAVLIAPALNAMALGDDLARALGTRLSRVRGLAAVSITLLAGGATAAVGPVAFIGLMAPHVVRRLLGSDQRFIILGTLVSGPIILLAADILGRLLLRPGELEAGIVTAFVGAPLLILLLGRTRGSGS